MQRIKLITKFLLKNLLFAGILINLVFPLNKVIAQETSSSSLPKGGIYGLIISPPKKEYIINPGEAKSDSFTARHDYGDSNYTVTLYPIANDFTSDGKTGTPRFLDVKRSKTKSTLEDWISIKQNNFTLSHLGQESTINFTISVPSNAEPGSYYAAIVLADSNKAEVKTGSQQVGIISKLGMLIFVTVPGDLKTGLNLDSFKALDYSFNVPFLSIFEMTPINFETSINNYGNVYVIPGGNIFIYQDDITKPIYSFDFNSDQQAILSNSSRTYDNEWNDGFIRYDKVNNDDNNRNINFHFDNLNKIFIGKYNATLKLLYTDKLTGQLKSTDQTISFWIIPWKIILLLIFLIFLIILIIKLRNKNSSIKTVKKRS